MPSVEWHNFTGMRPMDSAAIGGSPENLNPVTLIENMVVRDDGVLARRSGFKAVSGTISAPDCHATFTPIDSGNPTMAIKAGTKWYHRDQHDAGWTEITYSEGVANAGQRGSFQVFNGELYYCDRNVSWRWGGVNAPAQTGMPYFDDGGYTGWNYDLDWTPDTDPLWWGPTGNANLVYGGKIGSFSVSYSWYDPVRNIYGPRSKAETVILAVQYNLLNIQLFGLKVLVPTPTVNYPAYDVAVWVSQSVQIGADFIGWDFGGGTGTVTTRVSYRPGEHLSDLHFLETIARVGERPELRKDNASLAASGRALDNFEPPHPSELMVILSDGSTLYFYPSATREGTGATRNYVEYSVGHPEQVGRDRKAFPARRPSNGPTIVNATGLRGKPIAAFDRVLLTDVAPYRIEFDGASLNLTELDASRAIVNHRAIAASPLGVVYMADEGVTLIQGDTSVRMFDDLIGFAGYVAPLTHDDRKMRTAIGEAVNKVFVWMPDTDPYAETVDSDRAHTAMVYDHAQQTLVRFSLPSTFDVAYACGGRLRDGTKLDIVTQDGTTYYWPSSSGKDGLAGTFQSSVVMECNERPQFHKKLTALAITFRKASAPSGARRTPSVKVESFDYPGNTEDGYEVRTVDADELTGVDIEYRRVLFPEMTGLQGRFFRITIATDTWDEGAMEIVKVELEYEADDSAIHGNT